ncbi:hypothetical protein OYE22_02485 [Streptomyces sp. 71268]|uniref:hypothetical protein n=1 Tax=Streptomyces sp. 71268 TaxID=3002640 RepID=UPI0023F9C1C2|nr:hypothetical protein [Streptomyces sp. 71268]WEV30094.1 hypothetical protein OYE22_02485 [Streptomyces sp. 71268]
MFDYLYLTDKRDGASFETEDETVIVTLYRACRQEKADRQVFHTSRAAALACHRGLTMGNSL